ncbi:hypothetical protein [Actinoplanes sp. M2I2]|uniref:hypothetical protein n=1 Tax=Actinoplanes sp. M2I2 TaxID=1734444 RepID=UPI0020207ABB|nr:hypothetical protein [Actinoplanes sp. M2I2]
MVVVVAQNRQRERERLELGAVAAAARVERDGGAQAGDTGPVEVGVDLESGEVRAARPQRVAAGEGREALAARVLDIHVTTADPHLDVTDRAIRTPVELDQAVRVGLDRTQPAGSRLRALHGRRRGGRRRGHRSHAERRGGHGHQRPDALTVVHVQILQWLMVVRRNVNRQTGHYDHQTILAPLYALLRTEFFFLN